MILGRPTNLWLGAITALTGVLFLILSAAGAVVSVELVAAIGTAEGAVILLIANQPPTLNPGDTIQVVTPPGQTNQTQTVQVQ